jgi:hypothetical protein
VQVQAQVQVQVLNTIFQVLSQEVPLPLRPVLLPLVPALVLPQGLRTPVRVHQIWTCLLHPDPF